MREYLQEDGSGQFKQYLVNDLLPPPGQSVDLLLVLESPHVDELRTGIPLSGDAGQRALAFLSPLGPPPEALGPNVAGRHSIGEYRVGIMNVSPVPLQAGAFANHRRPPLLSTTDWSLMELVRSHRATSISALPTSLAIDTNRTLLPGLHSRLAAISFSTNAAICLAGNFVHRTWDAAVPAPGCQVLRVPHPSNGWWTRTARQAYKDDLAELKARFGHLAP